MARGWESKDVESQLDAFESDRRDRSAPQLTPDQIERQRRRESLELTRTRVLRDLDAARHPHHQQQLRAALAHVDAELAKLH